MVAVLSCFGAAGALCSYDKLCRPATAPPAAAAPVLLMLMLSKDDDDSLLGNLDGPGPELDMCGSLACPDGIVYYRSSRKTQTTRTARTSPNQLFESLRSNMSATTSTHSIRSIPSPNIPPLNIPSFIEIPGWTLRRGRAHPLMIRVRLHRVIRIRSVALRWSGGVAESCFRWGLAVK